MKKLLLHDPSNLGIKIFNAVKSSDNMTRRLSVFIPVETESSVLHNANNGAGTQINHSSIRKIADIKAKWFALDVGNSDLAGIDLTDGVISRLALFYKSKTAAQRLVAAAYPAGLEGSGWTEVDDGDSALLETTAIAVHPNAEVAVGGAAVGTQPRGPNDDTPVTPGLFASGSGFFITSDGYFLTNKHVANEPNCKFRIRLESGRETRCEVVRIDEENDIALMHAHVEGPTPFLKLAAADTPNPAAKVMVLGYPASFVLGFRMQVATGDVASVDENDEYPVILTLNTTHGNSGGPIIDKDENVVGILSAGQKVYNANYVRAISAGQIRKFLQKIGDTFPGKVVTGPTTRQSFEAEPLAQDARKATLLVLLFKSADAHSP